MKLIVSKMLTVIDLWSKNLYKRKNKNVSKQMEQKEQVVEDNDRDRYQKNNMAIPARFIIQVKIFRPVIRY